MQLRTPLETVADNLVQVWSWHFRDMCNHHELCWSHFGILGGRFLFSSMQDPRTCFCLQCLKAYLIYFVHKARIKTQSKTLRTTQSKTKDQTRSKHCSSILCSCVTDHRSQVGPQGTPKWIRMQGLKSRPKWITKVPRGFHDDL